MALLDFQHQLFGRNKLWGATVGTADLPTSAGIGDWTIGDIVVNLAAGVGTPSMWSVSAVGATGTPTFNIIGLSGGANQIRSVAAATTLLSSDVYLFVTAAAAVTLPAPSAALGTHKFTIKPTAQPVTVTAAGGSFDGVATGSVTLSSQQSIEVFTDTTNWFSVGTYAINGGPVRSVTSPGTLQATDNYIVATAGQITISPVANWVLGRISVVHAGAASVTVTPTAGTVNGAAALTLGANANAQIFTDGTNFFTAN